MIAFKKVKGPYGWLGNMSPHPIGGFRTAEHLFQATRFKDQAIIEEIKAQTSPMAAKMVAKKHLSTAELNHAPRSDRDVEAMLGVLRLKLAHNPELAVMLKATGDQTIIEDCTNRQNESGLFWGAALKDGVWVGENRLGKLWMFLRGDVV